MGRHTKSRSTGSDRRKTLQLCRQVQRALNYALGECGDDLLTGLYVMSIEPAPSASRLLVTVQPLDEGADPIDILQHVGFVMGQLRSDVAASIHRKKVPELMFHCEPFGSESPKNDGDGDA
jgi:hypothetical protein